MFGSFFGDSGGDGYAIGFLPFANHDFLRPEDASSPHEAGLQRPHDLAVLLREVGILDAQCALRDPV
jgi:hypothetical protein